jgi:hypothetical protein
MAAGRHYVRLRPGLGTMMIHLALSASCTGERARRYSGSPMCILRPALRRFEGAVRSDVERSGRDFRLHNFVQRLFTPPSKESSESVDPAGICKPRECMFSEDKTDIPD